MRAPAPLAVMGGLTLLWAAGCSTADRRDPRQVAAPSEVHLHSFGEHQREQMHSYVHHRAEELMESGRFASKDEAKAYARYEWSAQNQTARGLSGEGYMSWSSATAASAGREAEEEKFHQDLAEIGSGRP